MERRPLGGKANLLQPKLQEGEIMKPRWLRRHCSCPDCGKAFTIEELDLIMGVRTSPNGILKGEGPFNCPYCKAHWTARDFWAENQEKWNREFDGTAESND